MPKLTLEEQYLISCFTFTSKADLISDMEYKMQYLDEEMKPLAKQTLKKIRDMSDENFADVMLPENKH